MAGKNFKARYDCVIVGGGISGLTAAYHLRKRRLDVLVLERAERVGGVIRSESQNGFLIDYGPNSTLETSPEIADFVREIGLADDRIYGNDSANRRYVLRDRELRALPMSPPAFLKSNLFSFRAKLRLLREPFIRPAPPDKEETISEFVERRLGREFLDYAINPFVAGVYAGDPGRLSVRSAVRKVYQLEEKYGSLIKGQFKGAKERKKAGRTEKTRARLFSFRKGMSQLTEAIENRLDQSILTNADVRKVGRQDDGVFSVEFRRDSQEIAIFSRSLIITTPTYISQSLLQNFDPEATTALQGINYAPVAVVFLGFAKEPDCRPLDGFGFLVPEVERRKILGCIWSSTIFAGRAPLSGAALTVFVGGMRQPALAALPEPDLQALVLDELGDLMGLHSSPDFVGFRKWEKAIPQYELGHQGRIEQVEKMEWRYPGLFIGGNFRGGVSVGDCILRGGELASNVEKTLIERRAVPQGVED